MGEEPQEDMTLLVAIPTPRNAPSRGFRALMRIMQQGWPLGHMPYTREDICLNTHARGLLDLGYKRLLVLNPFRVHPIDIAYRLVAATARIAPTDIVCAAKESWGAFTPGELYPVDRATNLGAMLIPREAVERLGPPPWFRHKLERDGSGRWLTLDDTLARRCKEVGITIWCDPRVVSPLAAGLPPESLEVRVCEGANGHRSPDLAVAIPYEPYVHHLAMWPFLLLAKQGYTLLDLPATRCDVARTLFVEKLLETSYQWLLQLDSDHTHPPGIPDGLARRLPGIRGLQVLGGLNFRRGIPFDPCAYFMDPAGDGMMTLKEWGNKLIRVDILGSGSLMVHRNAFEKTGPPWWDYAYDEKRPEVFPGVDIAFGMKCLRHAIPAFVDPTVRSPHIIGGLVTEELSRRHQDKVLQYSSKSPYSPIRHATVQENQAILQGASIGPQIVVTGKPRVGFVTIWFERGQAYVTKMLRDVASEEYDTFVFARTGAVYGEDKLETQGFWSVPNLAVFPEYRIPPNILCRWIAEMDLDAVIFNEEYDWELVRAAKASGRAVLTYLDYYRPDWEPLMGLYDAVLCSTRRSHELLKDVCEARYVGWAVDSALFQPNGQEPEHTFFHNAGWLGLNYRKGTPEVLVAFDRLAKENSDVSLFVHAQAGRDKLGPELCEIVDKNDRIMYHVETTPAPGLYHKGSILLFPSRLEGLGLPLLEGMACGLPAIVTDAPPMNEFVRAGYNGELVRVAQTRRRADGVAFPETYPDVAGLLTRMRKLVAAPAKVGRMGKNAREYAVEKLGMEGLGERVNGVLAELVPKRRKADDG